MDINTSENLLDAAQLMHHSQEMQLAAYRKALNETSPEFTELSDSESAVISGGVIGPGGKREAIQFLIGPSGKTSQ